ESDGHQRGGIAQRGGQHFHGSDGSAAHHQTVHRRAHGIGVCHGDVPLGGARFGSGDGGLRTGGARGDPASSNGGYHDCTGHHHAFQNLHSGNRETGDRGAGGGPGRKDRGKRNRRGRPGRG